MALSVLLMSPQRTIFEGEAKSVIVPGESGVFEVAPFHKRIMSRLVGGLVFIDQQSMHIRRGIIKVNLNKVMIIVEEE